MSDEFRSNSNKSKEEVEEPKNEEKRVEAPIVQARARKRSGVSKFVRSLFVEDLPNIGTYILEDVLRPSIQNFFIDSVTDSISMLFGGDGGSRRRGRSGRGYSDRVSYRDYYDDDKRRRRRDRERDEDFRGYDLDDAIVDTRGEAERVIDKMEDMIDRYKAVSVADLYELVGLPSRYTDNKYGWTSIKSAKAQKVRGGYLIQLPDPKPLD